MINAYICNTCDKRCIIHDRIVRCPIQEVEIEQERIEI